MRVQRLSRAASSHGFAGLGIRASGGLLSPTLLRDFADTPREEGELALRASWLTRSLRRQPAGLVRRRSRRRQGLARRRLLPRRQLRQLHALRRLHGALVGTGLGRQPDPFDQRAAHSKHHAGTQLHRPVQDASGSRGSGPGAPASPWARRKSDDVPVPDVRFFAARVNFKPRPWLEFGLTRTAQWCGGDRPCDWDTFVGHAARATTTRKWTAATSEEQPGNQMAGYDMRLRSPWRALPLAFYTQWIGEDEAGGLPTQVHRPVRPRDLGIAARWAAGACAPNTPTPPAISRAKRRSSTAPTATRSIRRATRTAAGSSATPWTTTAACSRSPAC